MRDLCSVLMVSLGCGGLLGRVDGLSGSIVGHEDVQLRVKDGSDVVRGFN